MAEEVSQTVNNVFPACQQAYMNSQPILNEWTNHSAFYAIYPSYYYTFGQQWLRKWLQWFDGFVPGIHDGVSGILSTRLGTTLCYRLAEQVYGGGIMFANSAKTKDAKKALKFVSGQWNDDADFSNQILKAFILSAAGGTSYLKINVSGEKKLWVDTWRADQCWSDIDWRGNVLNSKFIVAKFTKTVPNEKPKAENFYIIERRFYATEADNKDYKERNQKKIERLEVAQNLQIGKPYVNYEIYRLQGYVNDFNQGVNFGRALNWEELPDEIKKSIKRDYGVIQLNVPQLLPFLDLGVYAFKWTSFISNLPQLPYGESLLAKVQTYLFEYDFMNSSMNTDFYLGRGRVLVPKQMQSPRPQSFSGQTIQGNYNQGLDSFLFTKVEYSSTEDKKPEAIQFQLRSQEWLASRNHLLESIATAVGISPSTIASYLNDSSARTAREISSEESSTALFVENRRKLFKKPINDALKTILLFYGFADCVEVKFSKSGQTNITLITENTTKAYQSSLRSLYQCVKDLNPDMSEEELETEIERIKKDKAEEAERQGSLFGDNYNDGNGDFGGMNETDGGDSNGEKAKTELASDVVDGNANGNKVDDKVGSTWKERLQNLFGTKKKPTADD